MAKKESVQKRLQRVRAPRIQLTYDVEIGDAIEQKELPFVIGVLGDFSGNPEVALPRPRDRKFVSLDPDNFDEVLSAMAPRATFRVENTLTGDGEFGVDLSFKSLEDFGPDAVIRNIEPLRKLYEARSKLSELRNKMSGNEKLEDILGEVMRNTEQLKSISQLPPEQE
jgi:type VI secretion system protein ImpB